MFIEDQGTDSIRAEEKKKRKRNPWSQAKLLLVVDRFTSKEQVVIVCEHPGSGLWALAVLNPGKRRKRNLINAGLRVRRLYL